MSSRPYLHAQTFVAGFVALTLLPGIWMFAKAPLTGLEANVLSGAAQRQYESRFDNSFPLRSSLRQTWAALKFGLFSEMAEGAVAGTNGVLFTSEELLPPKDSQDFLTALRAAQAPIEAAGAELVPVILPDKIRMMPDALPRIRSAQFAERYDHLLQMIAAEGLRTLDVRPALSGPNAFMRTDTHWSPEGARNVAQALSNTLAGKISSQTPFETRHTGTRRFDGDLLAFADTGIWRPYVGPAPERINTYDTQSAARQELGLFDDIKTPIALVGTSFSAREDFHFIGFLKSSLQAEVLSFAMEGRGPFTPMERFLADGQMTTTQPQIVLWEIPERYIDTWSTTP
ncbi:hypothetical protein [Shimia sp. R9_3]|uniref:alginate O-acetyltransferase AlgX-related protein n=1 Tax=Shimia sp. R9_3 TaxID=2821113 RepID=UPI001AD9F8CF|nr:hypothetical protein [Shimia sp. R9_3]MBO9401195.1 hypothetical protein [Shimia sp. R9_3]